MRKLLICVFSSFVILISAITFAQSSSEDFEITKSTIDNGGGTSSGGDFSLTGTIGQSDANPQISTGGGFLLAGGFWAKAHDVIFKNSFENN